MGKIKREARDNSRKTKWSMRNNLLHKLQKEEKKIVGNGAEEVWRPARIVLAPLH